MTDLDVAPEKGVWFITRGAQILEREHGGELAGATLWGMSKVVFQEAIQLQPRIIDIDPGQNGPPSNLVNELLYPDSENHIAYRRGRRMAPRLVRFGTSTERLALPEGPDWVLAPDRNGVFDRPEVKPLPARTLEPREVLVSVEATGLNFWDVFRSLALSKRGTWAGSYAVTSSPQALRLLPFPWVTGWLALGLGHLRRKWSHERNLWRPHPRECRLRVLPPSPAPSSRQRCRIIYLDLRRAIEF